jgi:hypothetical protein
MVMQGFNKACRFEVNSIVADPSGEMKKALLHNAQPHALNPLSPSVLSFVKVSGDN